MGANGLGVSAGTDRLAANPAVDFVPRSQRQAPRNSSRRMTAVELFCGVGGMGLGFEQAGFDVLAAVDLDPIHLAAHKRNFPLCEPLCEDISDLSRSDLLSAARRGWAKRHSEADFAGPVDCLFGGPSCQGFSVIGRQNPRDPRNALVGAFAQVVASLRPRWFVLENVPGLVSGKYKATLRRLYADLRAADYQVAEPWLLNASDYGVPQERKRVFVVGARADMPLPSKPSSAEVEITVSEALDDISFLGRFQRLYGRDDLELTEPWYRTMTGRQSEYVRQLNRTIDSPDDFSDPRSWDRYRLSSVGLTCHSDEVIERFEGLGPGERDAVGRLPRLDHSAQSPTLRAGTGRDHGSFTSARPVHHRSPRVITVREAARLQGFPDWFGFHATKWHGFRQVGNSVPPPLARAVASSVRESAGETPFRMTRKLDLGEDELLEMSLSEAADYFELDRTQLPIDVRREASSSKAEAA